MTSGQLPADTSLMKATVRSAAQLSVAVTRVESGAGTSATHSKVRSAGQSMVGGVVSLMVMVWVRNT